jgi:hypothetical protein
MSWGNRSPATRAADARRQAEYQTPEYKAARRAVKALVASGNAHCWRCGKHIPPGAEVHTGHDDNDRSILRGAECGHCNRKAGASKGARVANARRKAAHLTTSTLHW